MLCYAQTRSPVDTLESVGSAVHLRERIVSEPVKIDYFSDVLCVWAWIAQRRLLEIEREWKDQVSISHHYMDIFCDTQAKICSQWQDSGGYDGFGAHVLASAAPYADTPVNPQVWTQTRPGTSSNAHLLIKAAQLEYGAVQEHQLALAIRGAFFSDALDIAQMPVLFELVSACGLDQTRLQAHIESGTAIAALMSDLRLSQQLAIKGSPTWVMNDGRQILYGNVGYRIIAANIEELSKSPATEASWC